MTNDNISHSGKVVDVNPQFITVEIISASACSSCHASSLCSMSEQTVKKVTVPTPLNAHFLPGDEVNVSLSLSMGHKAVWIAYAIPLAVLLVCVMSCLGLGCPEWLAGLSGVGALALYYFCVWLFRDKLRNSYVFTVSSK